MERVRCSTKLFVAPDGEQCFLHGPRLTCLWDEGASLSVLCCLPCTHPQLQVSQRPQVWRWHLVRLWLEPVTQREGQRQALLEAQELSQHCSAIG